MIYLSVRNAIQKTFASDVELRLILRRGLGMGLVTIQLVNNIRPIKDADRVELATILGWNVMVRKSSMQIGDKVVYFEIDSLLPDIPQFIFLKEKGFPYRLKTEKYFKGRVVSQGLALPAKEFGLESFDVGADVTGVLNVGKYEKLIDPHLGGDNAGSFPNYIKRTDEIRLQAVPDVLEEVNGLWVYVTVKCDGTSATYLYDRDTTDFLICSRNWQKKPEDNNVYAQIADQYNLRQVLANTTYAIQGEICGQGIQKNPLGIKGHKLFVFNIYDYNANKYLSLYEMVEFCIDNGLPFVPFVVETIAEKWTVDGVVEMSKGKYEGTENEREGIVVRLVDNVFSDAIGGRMSFKVINPDYRD